MTIAFLILAAAQGVAISNSPAPETVMVPGPAAPPGPPPAIAPHVVRNPQERRPLLTLFSPDDYPMSAQGSGVRGVIAVTLGISPDGRVASCTIRRSSRLAVLDVSTCNILRRRARYTPAMDSNGNPVAGTIRAEVDWDAVFARFAQ